MAKRGLKDGQESLRVKTLIYCHATHQGRVRELFKVAHFALNATLDLYTGCQVIDNSAPGRSLTDPAVNESGYEYQAEPSATHTSENLESGVEYGGDNELGYAEDLGAMNGQDTANNECETGPRYTYPLLSASSKINAEIDDARMNVFDESAAEISVDQDMFEIDNHTSGFAFNENPITKTQVEPTFSTFYSSSLWSLDEEDEEDDAEEISRFNAQNALTMARMALRPIVEEFFMGPVELKPNGPVSKIRGPNIGPLPPKRPYANTTLREVCDCETQNVEYYPTWNQRCVIVQPEFENASRKIKPIHTHSHSKPKSPIPSLTVTHAPTPIKPMAQTKDVINNTSYLFPPKTSSMEHFPQRSPPTPRLLATIPISAEGQANQGFIEDLELGMSDKERDQKVGEWEILDGNIMEERSSGLVACLRKFCEEMIPNKATRALGCVGLAILGWWYGRRFR